MTTAIGTSNIHVNTTRFGEVDVQQDLVITLPEGIIGFEDCTRYVVLQIDYNSQFKWLQCLDDGSVAFPIIDPWQFRPDYAPEISDMDALFLKMDERSERLVFVIVTVPRNNPHAMTANLLGPIIINPLTSQGKQVIVTNEQYGTRHGIMDEMARAGLS